MRVPQSIVRGSAKSRRINTYKIFKSTVPRKIPNISPTTGKMLHFLLQYKMPYM